MGVVAVTSMEAYSTVRTGTLPERLAAAAGLALALVLLRLPFRHTVRTVRWARRAGRRPLTRSGPRRWSKRSGTPATCGPAAPPAWRPPSARYWPPHSWGGA
ncbi:hypothetical protein SHKM778_94920 (plasmid) [Streptomyces sp. KM77-8]|uniref:Uncharacterized protein n=1 Tax=Streptomyces haneummycinicus TaxID=3074435 RepID=A0AAT9I0R2_9ACTN